MCLFKDSLNTDGFSVIAITIVTTVVLLAAGGGYTYWAINQPSQSSVDVKTNLSDNSTSSQPEFFSGTDDFTSTNNSEAEVSHGSGSTSVSVTSSLSVNNIQQQSIRKGLTSPMAEGVSLKYAEFISQDSQRVILQSDAGTCNPQDFTVSPGEEYSVSCDGEEYQLEFFAYNEENDMISFSVGDSTAQGSAVSSLEDHAVVTSSEEGDIKVCESSECMNEALAVCQPAELSYPMEPVGAAARYEILGESTSGACRVELIYTKSPNPSWVNKPLVCDYDTSLVIENASALALNSAAGDNAANCTGPLLDVIRNY